MGDGSSSGSLRRQQQQQQPRLLVRSAHSPQPELRWEPRVPLVSVAGLPRFAECCVCAARLSDGRAAACPAPHCSRGATCRRPAQWAQQAVCGARQPGRPLRCRRTTCWIPIIRLLDTTQASQLRSSLHPPLQPRSTACSRLSAATSPVHPIPSPAVADADALSLPRAASGRGPSAGDISAAVQAAAGRIVESAQRLTEKNIRLQPLCLLHAVPCTDTICHCCPLGQMVALSCTTGRRFLQDGSVSTQPLRTSASASRWCWKAPTASCWRSASGRSPTPSTSCTESS